MSSVVSRRHGDGSDTALATGLRHVDGVLVEDHRVVVGEGDATAPEPHRRLGQLLGRRRVRQPIHLTRLTDVPVLTELARQIATGGAERENRRPRQEVVERLLLYRIDAEAAGAAVGREDDLLVLAHADEAHAALTLPQPTEPRTEIALHPSVLELVPILGRYDRIHDLVHGHTIGPPLPGRQRLEGLEHLRDVVEPARIESTPTGLGHRLQRSPTPEVLESCIDNRRGPFIFQISRNATGQ